jgi:hypothetical protein
MGLFLVRWMSTEFGCCPGVVLVDITTVMAGHRGMARLCNDGHRNGTGIDTIRVLPRPDGYYHGDGRQPG